MKKWVFLYCTHQIIEVQNHLYPAKINLYPHKQKMLFFFRNIQKGWYFCMNLLMQDECNSNLQRYLSL